MYNAFVQFFASREAVRRKALAQMHAADLEAGQAELFWYATSVWGRQATPQGEQTMQALTTEEMIAEGREWARILIQTLPPEERLAGMRPEERLAGLEREEAERLMRVLEEKYGLRPTED